MGLLWRLFAPRPLKKARRALHPSWVVEDAIVRSVRGSHKRQRPRPPVQAQSAREPPRQPLQSASGNPQSPPRLEQQIYRATLIFPDGGRRPCCADGHPTPGSAQRHAEQVVDELQDQWRNYVKGYARTGGRVIPQLDPNVAYSVQQLLTNGIVEPTSEELLREASTLHPSNPRAGLLLAVAAAEVGFKELVIDLIPEVRWLALEAPSPPLVGLLKNSLPELPVRQKGATPPPPGVRNVMLKAIEARNDLAHQGEFNRRGVDLYEVIDTVRLLLRQFAYYRGFTWVTPAW